MTRHLHRVLFVGSWLALVLALPAWGQQTGQRATLHVRLPAGARLIIDDKMTQQTGELRHFYSPPLQAGKSYHYTLEWSFTRDGKLVKDKRVVHFLAGDDLNIDLLSADGGKGRMPDKGSKEAGDKDDVTTTRLPETKQASRRPDVNYVASPPEVVDKMVELADLKKNDVLYDLGCGDGRIAIAAAKKHKCKAVGIEIDPKWVEKARANVKAEKLEDLVEIREGDIFKADLKPASVVTMYLLDHLNARLLPQLQELKPGSRIVSHDFEIEGYPPDQKVSVPVKVKNEEMTHKVYLWVAPLKKK